MTDRRALPRTFRVRLTAWYLGLFALLFVGFSVFLYGMLARSLAARLEEMLGSEVNTAANLLPDEIEEAHGDALAGAREVVSELRFRSATIAVWMEGKLLASSGPLPAGAGTRSARRTVVFRGRTYEVVAIEPLDAIAADLRIVRGVMFVALPLFLALAGLGGYAMVKRNLRPLEKMAEQARRISGNNLNARLEAGRAAEELALLADSFNDLLGRLDQSFEALRRFVADASHELRTPLAIIRGEADVALAQERGGADYRESLGVILDESRRLSRLVDDLLNLARADAGHVKLDIREFYFNDLLADCCRSVQALAAGRGIALECRAAPDIPFCGDEQLLRRLVINLLDNAIRYTGTGGRVTADVASIADGHASGRPSVRLRIFDTGVGIAPDAATHVFERFFRADPARSRADGGFGLGLSIVKWIAESHHGAVELESRLSEGSTFTVTLPKDSP